MDQLPRLGKRGLICLLLFTCNYVVSVWRGFLFLWVLRMGYVILLWHSLSLPYNYFEVLFIEVCVLDSVFGVVLGWFGVVDGCFWVLWAGIGQVWVVSRCFGVELCWFGVFWVILFWFVYKVGSLGGKWMVKGVSTDPAEPYMPVLL